MLRAKRPHIDRQRALVKRLGLGVPAQGAIGPGKVIETSDQTTVSRAELFRLFQGGLELDGRLGELRVVVRELAASNTRL